jgi:hypothetical protein
MRAIRSLDACESRLPLEAFFSDSLFSEAIERKKGERDW